MTTELDHCPTCGRRVQLTHRCPGRPVDLAPMPADFRDRLARARLEHPPTPVDTPLPPFTEEGVAP